MPFKAAGDLVYLLGETGRELAGSHYAALVGLPLAGERPPQAAPQALDLYRALHRALQEGLATAVHDCSEGGAAVTLAEMALAGALGAQIDLAKAPGAAALDPDALLFSESLARLVVTVRPENRAPFEAFFAGLPCGQIGAVTAGPALAISHGSREILHLPITQLDNAFRGHTKSSQLSAVSSQLSATPPQDSGLKTFHSPSSPKVLILHANGTNRDRDAALACRLAGGDPEIVHINQLLTGERRLLDYGMLVVPGGFSYGDDLGAGVLWAADLRHLLGETLEKFVAGGRPVLGICNGFQVLVKTGLLSDDLRGASERPFTLTYNASGRFECRWVLLEPNGDSHCLFTRGLSEPIACPVAHGEGRFAVRDAAVVERLAAEKRITLTYAGDGYPANPNGSAANIAGICNAEGNVMGLMPHPENHLFPWQNPHANSRPAANLGLALFVNGVRGV